MKTLGRPTGMIAMAALLAGVTLLGPGVTGPGWAAARDYFLFGSALSLTGRFSTEAKSMMEGYELWKWWINKQGGIKVGDRRYRVEIKYYDDKSDAATAAKLVEKLITEDNVDLVFGPYTSGVTFAASAVSEKYRTPMFEEAGLSEGLFERGFKYLFATDVSVRLLMKRPMAYMVQELGVKKVAIVARDSIFPLTMSEAAKEFFERFGAQVIHFEKFGADVKDLTPILRKVQSRDPDMLMLGGHLQDSILVQKQLKEIGYRPKGVFYPIGANHPEFVRELGKDAEYATSFLALHPDMYFKGKHLDTRQFYELVKEHYGYGLPKILDEEISGAMAMCLVVQEVIETAGVTPPFDQAKKDKIRDTAAKTETMTFYGPVKFHEKGYNVAKEWTTIQVQQGQLVNVDPKFRAPKGKAIYPAPPWQ
jgi:branched-chain amino acid transport system substrate-binding protein